MTFIIFQKSRLIAFPLIFPSPTVSHELMTVGFFAG